MWWFLFKSINRITNQYYFGVHQTSDLFFGAEGSTDPYIGEGKSILKNLAEYGRHSFVVQTLICGDKDLIERRFKELNINWLDPFCLNTDKMAGVKLYNQKLKETGLSAQHRLNISQGQKGLKHTTTRKENVSLSKRGKVWINNGLIDKAVKPQDSIPDGWKLGRVFRKRVRVKGRKGRKPRTTQVTESKE